MCNSILQQVRGCRATGILVASERAKLHQVAEGADIGRTIRSTVGCRLKRLVRVRVRVEVRVRVRQRVMFRLVESRLREAVAHAAHRSEPEDITATCDESTTLAVIMNNVCRKPIIRIEITARF